MVFTILTMVFAALTMVFAILTMVFVVSTMVFVVLTTVLVTLTMVIITLTTVFVVPTMVLVVSTMVFGGEKMFSSFKTQSAEQLVTIAGAVIPDLTGNPALPAPTVDLKAVQAAADALAD